MPNIELPHQPLLAFCLVLATSITITTHAELPLQLIDQLRAAVGHDTGSEALSDLDHLRGALNRNDFFSAVSILQKISAANQNANAQELCSQLQARIFAAKRAAVEASITELPDLLQKAGGACLAAKSAQNLESTIIELTDRRDAFLKLDGAVARGAANRLSQAIKFLQLWQRYLNILLSDRVEAKARLIYLANIDISHLMIERSQLLAEIAKLADPTKPPPPPVAPSNVVDVKNDDGSSEISWTNNDESADGVVIEKQTLDGKWFTLEELPPNVTTLHVPNPYLALSR